MRKECPEAIETLNRLLRSLRIELEGVTAAQGELEEQEATCRLRIYDIECAIERIKEGTTQNH